MNASIKRGLTNDIDELKAKQDRLLTALLDGDIDREVFKLKKAEYEGKIKELEESQSKYSTDNKGLTDLLVQIADIAANAKKIFDSPIICEFWHFSNLPLSDSAKRLCLKVKALILSRAIIQFRLTQKLCLAGQTKFL